MTSSEVHVSARAVGAILNLFDFEVHDIFLYDIKVVFNYIIKLSCSPYAHCAITAVLFFFFVFPLFFVFVLNFNFFTGG